MKGTKEKLMIIFLILSLFLLAVPPNYATSTRAEKCKKYCPTSVSYLGYLPKEFKIRFYPKEGLKEFDVKVTRKISDGNFYYDIEKVGEIDSLIEANGIVQYGLAHFTLPVVTDNFLRSWDCQAAISSTTTIWKGDCASVGFNKFAKLEFLIAPFSLERK